MDARTISPAEAPDAPASRSSELPGAATDTCRRGRAASWTLAGGLGIALALVAAKLAVHLLPVGAFGYGFFVDELYYLAASEHLAWGFVDMPPLVPALTALVRATLGESLLAVRLLPAVAGAALVVLTA